MAEKNAAPKNFGFGEDEAMLRDLARKFLDEQLPIETLRRLVAEAPEPVYEPDLPQDPPVEQAATPDVEAVDTNPQASEAETIEPSAETMSETKPPSPGSVH